MFETLPLLALSMGLMSSLHCIGMCGPIALALPVKSGSDRQRFFALLIYNSGRVFTYAGFGAALGTLGTGLAWMGLLKYLSIVSGVLMLIYVLWPKSIQKYLQTPPFWNRIIQSVKRQMSVYFRNGNSTSWFLMGLLNGTLPCGMVSLALVSSLATGTAAGGAVYMLLFGVGTFPMMMLIGFFKQFFSVSLRNRVQSLTPVLLGIAGIVLILRGSMIQPVQSKEHSIPVCIGK